MMNASKCQNVYGEFSYYRKVNGMFTISSFVLHRAELFISEAGARENANRVLVVITDGESHDRSELGNAAQDAEQKKITRYAIGVRNFPTLPIHRTIINVLLTVLCL